jgi:hypothetical protein
MALPPPGPSSRILPAPAAIGGAVWHEGEHLRHGPTALGAHGDQLLDPPSVEPCVPGEGPAPHLHRHAATQCACRRQDGQANVLGVIDNDVSVWQDKETVRVAELTWACATAAHRAADLATRSQEMDLLILEVHDGKATILQAIQRSGICEGVCPIDIAADSPFLDEAPGRYLSTLHHSTLRGQRPDGGDSECDCGDGMDQIGWAHVHSLSRSVVQRNWRMAEKQ